jgi:threonine/homoserine/homoserine lactone efflux protein
MQFFSILLLGFVLSFLGQLPVGVISITATQIAVQENFRNAWKYSFGIALIEMVYLRLVLFGVQWVMGQSRIYLIFNFITAVFFAVLGIACFISSRKQDQNKKALLLNNRMDRFLLGLTISALNPAQIPFWVVWTGYFLNLNLLKPGFGYFNLFTLGSGCGTVCGLAVYMYGGNWLVARLKAENQALNKLMGLIFFIAAIIQLFRVFKT